MAEAQKEENSGLIQQMMDAVQGHGPTAKKTGDASLLSLDEPSIHSLGEPPVMAGFFTLLWPFLSKRLCYYKWLSFARLYSSFIFSKLLSSMEALNPRH